MSKLKLDIELILLGAVAALLAFLIFAPYKKVPFILSTRAEVPDTIPTSIPSPTPTSIPVYETSSIDSSEGSYSLIMKKQKTPELNSFEFLLENKTDNFQRTIMIKFSTVSDNMFLPDNAWSPEKMYVFIKETTDSKVNYYVVSSSGEIINENSTFFNVTDLFIQRYPDYAIQEVTGWLSESILIINSYTDTGKVGPSFWFNVQNRSFGQLGVHYG